MISQNQAATTTQDAIIEAAEGLFSRFGFARVTMDEIAGEAGLKKPSLYYYFPTKEDLFKSVVEKKRAEFRDRVEQVLVSKRTAGSRIEQYVMIRFDYFKNLQELNILDFKQATRNAPALIEMFRQHAQEELSWLSELLAAGRQNGEFCLSSSRKIAELFLHSLQGLRLRVMRESQYLRPSPDSLMSLQIEMRTFTGIFLAGISNREVREV